MVSSTTKWIFTQMIRKKRLLIQCICFTIIFSTLFTVTPLLTGLIMNSIENELKTSTNVDKLIYYCVLLLIVALGAYLFDIIGWYSGEIYSATLTRFLREEIFNTLQQQSHKYYDNQNTGDLLSKATSDILYMWDLYYCIPYLALSASTKIIIAVIMLYIIDTQFGIIALLAIPVIIFVSKDTGTKFGKTMLEARKKFGDLSRILQENLDGVKVSRAFGSHRKEIDRFNSVNTAYRNSMYELKFKIAAFYPRMQTIAGILTVIVLIIGSFKVMDQSLTIGMLIAVILYTTSLSKPVDQLSDAIVDIGIGYGASKRIIDVLESTPDISEHPNANHLTGSNIDIQFEDISFNYRTEPILANINLYIHSGESIVFLGASGSGKSSLINLIPRFYDVTHGTVKIAGIDVRMISLDSLRSNIGFVDQETFLFNRTVRENIAFGHPTANISDIMEVAHVAKAHEFIQALPQGYDTKIGERGVTLSGGQKQRLSIARALLNNPPIIIFDDSLSAVDIKTEKEIRDATMALLKNRTTIIVSQRLSFIKNVNKIVILQKGRIIEEGSHIELEQKNGLYSKLLATEKDGLLDLTILNGNGNAKIHEGN